MTLYEVGQILLQASNEEGNAPQQQGSNMSQVFLVQHVHERDDGSEDVKVVGVYSSRETLGGGQWTTSGRTRILSPRNSANHHEFATRTVA